MKEFTDADGQAWTATVMEEDGADYKGRFFLVMNSAGGEDAVELRDVRWNNERTARRSIETMSVVELRRRLRLAAGRHGSFPAV